MSGVVGVELTTDRVRAVARGRFGSAARAFETAWDAQRPAEAVAVLRAQIGAARRIALSIGLGFLHVKHVSLPPVALAERRRMLALEPDRFFPVQSEPIVVALERDSGVAFAIDADLLSRWVAAFAAWAPVDLVEPAPISLARALARSGAGVWVLPTPEGECGVAELRAGRLHSVRRIAGDDIPAGARPVPAARGAPADHRIALGAAMGVDAPLEGALLSEAHAAGIRRRRAGRTAVAAFMCFTALGLALWSLARSRERTLERIRGEIAQLETRAAPAIELRDRLAALDAEGALIAALQARRADPLRILGILSEKLPADATVLSLRATGDAWQIDGRATDAAAILPALDGDARFENVRFLSASTRFREGERTWETFSIAFRVRPPA